jgi:Novel toxin 14/Domain of unknown function (DUF4157)
MKGLAKQSRSSVSNPAHGTAGNVQAKPRSGAGNHHRQRNNRFESQADEASRRFLLGEGNIARIITPAPASSFAAPTSQGEQLPTMLRLELEESFGADLSAVRVHRDPFAAFAVRLQHAAAFTSGRDIFFGERQWSPWTSRGRALLAHEIAHSLQQTGIKNSDGILKVTQRPGGVGDIQCADLSLEGQLEGLEVGQPVNEQDIPKKIVEVAALHRSDEDADEDVKKHSDSIQALANTQTDNSEIAKALIANAEAPSFPKDSKLVARLYFDCFKALGLFEKAMWVVRKSVDSIPDKTALHLSSFYVSRMRGYGPTVSKILAQNKVTSRYWKRSVLESFRISFYGLLRVPQDLDPQGKFRKIISDEFGTVATTKPLAPNERTLFALLAFLNFDAIRQLSLTNPDAAQRDISLFRVASLRRDNIAQFVEGGRLKALAESNNVSPEIVELCEEIDADVVPLAKEAVEFWSRIQSLSMGVLQEDSTTDLDELQKRRRDLAQTLKTIRALKGLEKSLKDVAQIALRFSPDGQLPSESQFRADLRLAHNRLRSLTFTYDQGLIQLERDLFAISALSASKQKEAADRVETWRKQADAYGAALFLLLVLDEVFLGIDIDKELRPTSSKTKLTPMESQLRKGHLLRYFQKVARAFRNVGNILGYSELKTYGDQVEVARAPDLKKSHIALFGTFEPIATELEDFRGPSFPRGPLRGLEPLTGADVQILVYDLYYSKLADRIREVLNQRLPDGTKRRDLLDPNAEPVVNEALRTLSSFKPPHRFRMKPKDVGFYVRLADSDNVDVLIQAHEKYKEFLKTIPEGELIAVHASLGQHMFGVVLWAVPSFEDIVWTLAEIPGLTEAKLKNGKTLGQPTSENWWEWLMNLKQIKGGTKGWHDLIFEALKQSMESSVKFLNRHLRAASINFRRSHTPDISAKWQAWDRYRIQEFTVPNKLLERMISVAGSLQPADEQKLHVSAMLLELAPALHNKLASIGRLDVILALLPHLIGVNNLLTDSAQVAQIKKLLDLNFPESEFSVRVGQLKSLQENFTAVQKNAQSQTKLAADTSRQQLFVPGRGYPIKADDPDSNRFKIEGVRYELLKIHTNFQFIPAMLVPPSAINWPATEIGRSELFDGNGAPVKDKRAELKLFDIKRNDVVITVTGDNDRLLSEITYAVHMEIVLRQLADLEEILNTFGEGMVTAIQIVFPEFAVEIGWAEIAMKALQFLTSPEFDEIKSALDGDSVELLGKIWSTVKERFSLDTLWDYLLFDRDVLGPLAILAPLGKLLKRKDDVDRKGKHEESKSSVVRVFKRLEHVAEGVGHSFVSLHDHVNVPVRRTQEFVVDHPLVGLILRVIADNLYRLEAIRPNHLAEDVRDLAKETLLGGVSDFLKKVEEILENLNSLELPQEIVPLDLLIEMLVNFIIDRLPMKYRVPLRAFKAGLEKFNLWSKLFNLVGDELKHHDLDPNIYWRDTIRAELEPHFDEAVKAIAGEMNSLFARVPFLKEVIGVVAPGIKLQFGEGDFPETNKDEEAQRKPSPGASEVVTHNWNLHSAGSGVPLDSRMLADSSRRLGHDFSDVRLHTEEAARPFTGALQAEALTSGSHIFLRPGLSPNTSSGRQTLYHELGHVLQQRGPSPLDGRRSSTPTWGTPHVGLNFNLHLESEADRIAHSAESFSRPAATGALGIQPRLTDTIARFFKEVGDPRMIREHTRKVEKTGKSDQRGWPQNARELASADKAKFIGQTLIETLKKNGAVKAVFAPPFDASTIPELIAEHLAEKKTIDFEDVIGRLVRRSLLPVKKAKTDDKQKDSPQFSFDPKRFVFELEDYLTGKTGISLDLVPNLETTPGSEDKILKLDTPFSAVEVSYLHLPLVGPVSRLWRKILEHTFSNITDQDELRKRQSKAWLILLGQPLALKIYDKKKIKGHDELVLSKTIVTLVEAALEPKTALSADALPTWSDYVKPLRVEPDLQYTKFGQIGLRIGTYKEGSGGGLQQGQDRDAHHTVQFLLLEYFNNQKDQKPFPEALSLYPGVKGKGRSVDQIGVVDTAGVMQSEVLGEPTLFSTQIQGRGPAMPTILISKHTHSGDVHITPKPDESPEKQSSQGAAVHGHFRAALGDYADILKSRDALKSISNIGPVAKPVRVKDKAVTPEHLSKVIYNAAVSTYREVRETMEKKLGIALDTREVEYFESVVKTDTAGKKYKTDTAEILDHAYVPDATKLSTVKSHCASETRRILKEQFGFPDD